MVAVSSEELQVLNVSYSPADKLSPLRGPKSVKLPIENLKTCDI